MEQRYLCFAVFGQMLRNDPGMADPGLLQAAVAAGLTNEDGRARSEVSSVYQTLSFERLKPLLPAILAAVAEPSPSGEMFADTVRVRGLQLLAKHHVEEGIDACVDYIRTQNKWASEKRTPELLAILESYGSHARRTIPDLRKIAEMFDQGEEGFPGHLSKQKAQMLREAVIRIEAATERPELMRLK